MALTNRDTLQLIEQVKSHLSRLPEDKIIAVLDFVQFLATRSAPTTSPHSGSPEALQECIGIWQFEPGELDEILLNIDQSRLMELDEENDRLLA